MSDKIEVGQIRQWQISDRANLCFIVTSLIEKDSQGFDMVWEVLWQDGKRTSEMNWFLESFSVEIDEFLLS